jgi:hypothetical protein
MTDALRSDRSAEALDRERDARIEELLLAGLDHYFAGQHELAINVWTRVLFLDRGHATARAYIERARCALSEKQREGDELLHTGAAALNRGDRAAARQLLTSAVERGSSGEDALALLHRLDRLDAASAQLELPPAERSADAQRRSQMDSGVRRVDSRVAWVAAGLAGGILIAALAGTYLWIAADPYDTKSPGVIAPALAEDPLPVPAACEIRLSRARDLFAQGRLSEAAAELEPGDPDERHRESMDELKAAIQRQLLGSSSPPSSPGSRTRTVGPASAPPSPK